MEFAFRDHVLDVDRRELRRGAELVALEPQVFDLLVYLVRNRDRVVSKDDLLASVWGGRIVSETTLTSRINAARKAIGDSGETQSLIRTLPRKGVRFVGTVEANRNGVAPAETVMVSDAQLRPVLALPDKPSIAVLPFANLSGDPEQEHFADGLVEDLITGLSRLRWLFVIARSSTFTYKGKAADVRQIGVDLGVRYVLEGSVRRAGNRVRISAQLIEAETGRHVWAERYDRGLQDLFEVQDEISDTIAATLEPEISAAERERARRKPPGDLGAWELYQRAMWHLLRRNREDFTAARIILREAIALDPAFAPAYAAFAVSAFWLITHDFSENAEATRTELVSFASQAVELDPRDAFAHSAMGLAFMECAEHAKAIAEHEIATALNPSSSFGHWCFGYALARADRNGEALAQFDLALRLSPRDPAAWSYWTLRASALYQLKRYDEAAAAAEYAMRAQLVDTGWPLIHRTASLGQLGRRGEAFPVVAELQRRRPELTIADFLAWPHNRSRSAPSLAHIAEGLRKAGLPEQ